MYEITRKIKRGNKGAYIIGSFILFAMVFVGLLLMFNYRDPLIKHIPADAQAYIHVKQTILPNLGEKAVLLTKLLANKVETTPEALSRFLRDSHEDFSVFIADDTYYIAVRQNEQTLSTAKNNKLLFETTGKVLYIPKKPQELGTKAHNLSTSIFYKPKVIDFSKARLFIPDLQQLDLPGMLKPYVTATPLLATVHTNEETLIIRTSMKLPKTEPLDNPYYGDYKPTFSYHNVDISSFPLTPSILKENIAYAIAHTIKGPISFAQASNDFIMTVPKESASKNEIESIIAYNIALLLPEEHEKQLPDGTTAIHYVANPSSWKFSLDQGNETLEEPSLDLNITINETTKAFTITNNTKLQRPTTEVKQQKTYLNPSSCPVPATAQVFLKGNIIGLEKYIKNLTIVQEQSDILTICID